MATVEDFRRVALALPRSTEHLIRDRVKFRVGSIVYLAFSRDESTFGFAYPKLERDALVEAEPTKFFPPDKVDERYQWVQAWTAAVDAAEAREIVVEAWRMVVPKKVSKDY